MSAQDYFLSFPRFGKNAGLSRIRALMEALGNPQAVSYTHLDVYKRQPVYCLVVCPSGISGDGYVLNVEKQRQLLPEWKDLKTGLVESCRWYLRHPEDVRKKGDVSFIDQNLAL